MVNLQEDTRYLKYYQITIDETLGGYVQYVVENYQQVLELLYTIPLQ